MTNKERFKANIRLFEFEPHSYCNRKCWFCPNSTIDRTGPARFMDPKVYTQALKDLGSIDYSEAVCFAGWCEPFSQPSFIDYVAEASLHLPNAMLIANTNTDYLSNEVAKDIFIAGLNVIKAQLYFDKDEPYSYEATKGKMLALSEKLSNFHFVEREKGRWFALLGEMVIVAYSKDFRKVGHNRCDTMIRKRQKRYHTCGEAIQMFGINHNGWAVPCCNIRSDYPPHKKVLLGKMDDTPGKIFELYQGVLLPGNQYPCHYCMGKQWHADHRIVFDEVIRELKSGK